MIHPTVRSVFRQEVQSQTGQHLFTILVYPQQLQFTDAQQIRVPPHFHKEKLTQRHYPFATVFRVSECLVERVGPVMSTRASHQLQQLIILIDIDIIT